MPEPSSRRSKRRAQEEDPAANEENEVMEEDELEDEIAENESSDAVQSELPQGESHKATDERLMITKLVLENFKSYAGTQEVGPFHKCFSSVVGPNGSGKSNVIDSLLFVFGRRAKDIRSGKVSHLIHNSSDHQNLDSCKVSVHFVDIKDQCDDPDAYEVIPGTELVVSRTAYRNNSSCYHINGTKATYKEVGTLLRKRGIDLDHNRFLILQGEVEQIAMMPSKGKNENDVGLLEYLEDIIGSEKYKQPIEEAEKVVEELKCERTEKLNRVKIVEKDKDALEESKSIAETFIHKENEKAILQSSLFQYYCFESHKNVEVTRQKHEALETKLAEEKKRLEEFQTSLTDLEKQFEKESEEYEKIVKAAEKSKADFAAFERKDIKFREDLKHAKNKDKKLVKNLEKETNVINEQKSWHRNHESDIEKHQLLLATLKKRLIKEEETLNEIYDSLKDKTTSIQEQIELKQKEMIPWNTEMNEFQSKIDIAKSEFDMIAKKYETAQKNLDTALGKIKEAKNMVPECESKIRELKKKMKTHTKELTDSEAIVQSLSDLEQKLVSDVRQAHGKLEEYKTTAESAKSKSSVLEFLGAESRSGRLSGFHGRLGGLGTIPQKYDAAITTACAALGHIVVDTVACAQTCVNLLKQKNLGRATFIILEKIAHCKREAEGKISPPENVERLYDLVQPKDPKFKTAFYFALRDTLVCSDLTQARRVSIANKARRYRVVTLKGEVVDVSGAMSGGGNKVSRGGMSASFGNEMSPEEYNNLEHSFKSLNEELADCRNNQAELLKRIDVLKEEICNGEVAMKRYELDIESMQKELKDSENQIKPLEKAALVTVADQKKQKELEANIDIHEKGLKKSKGQAEKIEAQLQELNKKILDIGGVRLKSQKAKVENVNLEIDELNGNITKVSVQMKSCAKTIEKAEKKVSSLEKEIEDSRVYIEKVKAEFAELEEGAAAVLQAHKEAETLMEDMQESLSAVKAKYNEFKEQVTEMRKDEIDLTNDLETINKMLQGEMGKEKHWVNLLKKLEIRKTGLETEEEEQELPELKELSEEEISNVDAEKLEYDIKVIEQTLEGLKPNLQAIDEYKAKHLDYLEKVSQLEAVTEKRDQARNEYDDLRKKRLDEFMVGFSIITMKLKEMYQMITLGGDAELELVDSLDPFSEGIVFSVRPPKKSWKNISNLSGGEKTLSSLALVFALHHFKPTPLYVMDEIDAALDFKNVSIVANYIKERTKNAQFVIISLRNNMFELADRLVGIYKTNNCTKSVTINPKLIAMEASGAR
eukprot:Nk52_evm6s39 gene=Nk52_evmTU6s39